MISYASGVSSGVVLLKTYNITSTTNLDSNTSATSQSIPYPINGDYVQHNVNMVSVRMTYIGKQVDMGGTVSVIQTT